MYDSSGCDRKAKQERSCFADVSPEDLDALQVRCVVALAPHLAGYPWQLERFELRSSHRAPPPSHSAADKRSAPQCLWGTLRFGDAVDDEWFATWLLRELTRCISGTTGEPAFASACWALCTLVALQAPKLSLCKIRRA